MYTIPVVLVFTIINASQYSQTCEQRSPKGDTDYGPYRQAVSLFGRFFILFNH